MPAANSLFVRNTPDNLAIVEMLVEQASASSPSRLVASVQLMEVNQTNFDEFRTDIGIGPANVPAQIASSPPAEQRLRALSTSLVLFDDRRPPTLRGNSGTAQHRLSTDQRTERSNLDSASPAAFQLLGAFTDPQFQVLITAISRKGHRSHFRPLRDHEERSENGDRDGARISVSTELTRRRSRRPSIRAAPSRPAGTPTGGSATFRVADVPDHVGRPSSKEVGSLLEVEAVVSEDGRQVELTLAPSTTEFEGFIDYGTDFHTNFSNSSSFDPVSFSFNNSQLTFAVDNPILQPVFRNNKVVTAVTIWDGSTIVLGSLISEKTTDINDKVPILGDIPFLGRLWPTKMKQVEKKNVIFFVTVKVIDPSGQAINQTAGQAAAR